MITQEPPNSDWDLVFIFGHIDLSHFCPKRFHEVDVPLEIYKVCRSRRRQDPLNSYSTTGRILRTTCEKIRYRTLERPPGTRQENLHSGAHQTVDSQKRDPSLGQCVESKGFPVLPYDSKRDSHSRLYKTQDFSIVFFPDDVGTHDTNYGQKNTFVFSLW